MIGIYKIVSPSGKIYIGQSVNIGLRKKSYKYLKCIRQPGIYNSIKKYGWTNHVFSVIEECDHINLNLRERYWQDFYDSTGAMGLNCLLTNTDTLPKRMSEASKKKLSLIMGDGRYKKEKSPSYGKVWSQVEKDHMRKVKLERSPRGVDSPHFGKPKSKLTRDKISETKKSKNIIFSEADKNLRKDTCTTKNPVIVYSLEGEKLFTFESIKETNRKLRELGYKTFAACISACCRKYMYKKHAGLKFEYLNIPIDTKKNPIRQKVLVTEN